MHKVSLSPNHQLVIFANKTPFESYQLSILEYVGSVTRFQVPKDNSALVEPNDGMAAAHMSVTDMDMTFPTNNIWLSIDQAWVNFRRFIESLRFMDGAHDYAARRLMQKRWR
jgi:hypothetical protein